MGGSGSEAGTPSALRLFGVLPPGLFGVFHKASRGEYARIILEVWRAFYADPLRDHPGARDISGFIDDRLRERRAELSDGEGDGGETPGQGAYRNLVEAGWLVPYRDGYRTFVEMPEVVGRLVRFLSDLERGSAATLGGAVAAMLSALRAAKDHPEANALAVRDTAQRAEEFLWRLRTLVTGLRRLEAAILDEPEPGRALGRFFDSFLSVVVSDWHALKTAQNPYRHRGEIVDLATWLLDNDDALRRLALTYRDQELAPDLAEARSAVVADLERIREGLLGLDLLMHRIDGVRRRVERRIAITVAYMDLAGEATALRIQALLQRLGREGVPGEPVPMATLAPPLGSLSPETLAMPRAPRERIAAAPPRRDPPDPRLPAFVLARREFLDRIRVGNRMLAEFVERQCSDGQPRRAAELRVERLEDVVALCALPVIAVRRREWPGFAVDPQPGRAVTALLDGPDFILRPALRAAPRGPEGGADAG